MWIRSLKTAISAIPGTGFSSLRACCRAQTDSRPVRSTPRLRELTLTTWPACPAAPAPVRQHARYSRAYRLISWAGNLRISDQLSDGMLAQTGFRWAVRKIHTSCIDESGQLLSDPRAVVGELLLNLGTPSARVRRDVIPAILPPLRGDQFGIHAHALSQTTGILRPAATDGPGRLANYGSQGRARHVPDQMVVQDPHGHSRTG
jgi:hypothetical protein